MSVRLHVCLDGTVGLTPDNCDISYLLLFVYNCHFGLRRTALTDMNSLLYLCDRYL